MCRIIARWPDRRAIHRRGAGVRGKPLRQCPTSPPNRQRPPSRLPCRGCPRGTRQISDQAVKAGTRDLTRSNRGSGCGEWQLRWQTQKGGGTGLTGWRVWGKSEDPPESPPHSRDRTEKDPPAIIMFWKTTTKCSGRCTFVSSSVPSPPPLESRHPVCPSLRSSAAGPICPRTASRREMAIDRAPTTSSSLPFNGCRRNDLRRALLSPSDPTCTRKELHKAAPKSAIRPLALGQMKRHRMRPSGEKDAI